MSLLHAPTYRWTVEEYEELGRAGIFDGEKRVELLNGEIVVMSPIGYRHATAVNRLTKFFVLHARDRYIVSPQHPVKLDPRSAPQPDLALLHPSCDSSGETPTSSDVFLIIEIADSTVQYDRQDKGPAYALQDIQEYWLLNLEQNRLEIFRSPKAGAYRQQIIREAAATASPLAFPDLELRVGDFLP